MSFTRKANQTATCSIVTGTWDRTQARPMAQRLRDQLLMAKGLDASRPIAILRTPLGKPYLFDDPDLCWSTSSTAGAAGLAWCIGQQVGFDLERVDPEPPSETLLRNTLTAIEFNAWTRDSTYRYFTDLWTRKEAVLKCLGFGLHLPPNQISVGAPTARWASARIQNRHRCWVRSLRLTDRVSCAIACGHPDSVIIISSDVRYPD